MRYFLENEILKIEIESLGAEVKSVVRKDNNREYMWWGNKKFWGRTSPVLFPIVGSVRDKKFTVNGTEYPMGQHGFARDTEFSLVSEEENEIWFSIHSDEDTFKKFPYEFALSIGYKLMEDKLTILWKVENPGTSDTFFSIGAHPAFLCPIYGEKNHRDYKVLFEKNSVASDTLSFHGIDVKSGLSIDNHQTLTLDHGKINLTENFFDEGALIFENSSVTAVSLLTPQDKPVVKLEFKHPIFALWSPEGKNAPFICIEPWYGRCDALNYSGEFKDRKYAQKIAPKESFYAYYDVTFYNI